MYVVSKMYVSMKVRLKKEGVKEYLRYLFGLSTVLIQDDGQRFK